MTSVRVAVVNTHDGRGGAARAAYRLHRGLLAAGAKSVFVAAESETGDPATVRVRPDEGPPRVRARAVRDLIDEERRPYSRFAEDAYPLFCGDRATLGEALAEKLPPADVVNLHWTRDFLDWQAFFSIRPPTQPVVFTLHDAQPFTGGCHYSGGCTRFRDACGCCPWLRSGRANDLSAQILARKRAALGRRRPETLHVVSPSRWLAAEARSSRLFSAIAVTVIPNGLDVGVFRPYDRAAMRARFGVPEDRRVILFAAQHLSDPRKGLQALESEMSTWPEACRPMLATVGDATGAPATIPRLDLGSMESEADVAGVCSMADLLAAPSVEDNFPNTVAEAMACGVPVVAYPVGGLPDLVRPGETGFLARGTDPEALRACLDEAMTLSDERRRAMGTAARRLIETECSLEVQASRYIDLFRSMSDAGCAPNR